MITTTVNPSLTDALIDRLQAIWLAVTNAGGTVGFEQPVAPEQIETGVAGLWDEVLDGRLDLVVAGVGADVVGFGFLRPSAEPVSRHLGHVIKLQRDPAAAGRGIGSAVLQAIEAHAVERGISLLTLDVREASGTDRWYASKGYSEVARLPGWVRVAGQPVGLIVMAKELQGHGGGVSGVRDMASAATTDHDTGRTARTATAGGGAAALQMLIRRLDPDLPLPRYARAGDAGLDLYARERKVLPAGARTLMPTGVSVAIPEGHVGLIHPRSGLAVRHGLSIVNSPGTIDAGYRGELIVPLINLDPSATIRLERGDRIAQLLVQRVEHPVLVEVDALPDGIRGAGGFGSTGR